MTTKRTPMNNADTEPKDNPDKGSALIWNRGRKEPDNVRLVGVLDSATLARVRMVHQEDDVHAAAYLIGSGWIALRVLNLNPSRNPTYVLGAVKDAGRASLDIQEALHLASQARKPDIQSRFRRGLKRLLEAASRVLGIR